MKKNKWKGSGGKFLTKYRFLFIISGLLLSFAAGAQKEGKQMIVKNQSPFNFDETVSRIESVLKAKEIPVFAVFDHSRNAQEVGLKLNPNTVIVFGSPKVGTFLMQENPAISIELPLRISVWQNDQAEVWVAFPDMKQTAVAYDLTQSPIIKNMGLLLEKIVDESLRK